MGVTLVIDVWGELGLTELCVVNLGYWVISR